jgi:hypothetical protein
MKKLNFWGDAYESPVAMEVYIASEGVLCASGDIEKMGSVDDLDGWDN